MRVIKEDFNPSVDDIVRSINNVEDAYSELKSALFSLSYYLEDNYPEQAKEIDSNSNTLLDFGEELYYNINEIKDMLSASKEEANESMKVIKESKLKESVDQSIISKLKDYTNKAELFNKERLTLIKELENAFTVRELNRLPDQADTEEEYHNIAAAVNRFIDAKRSLNTSYGTQYILNNESLKESAPREKTDNLIDAVEGGLVDWETVARACLKYMSEDEVSDMCKVNDFAVATVDELEESKLNEKVVNNWNIVYGKDLDNDIESAKLIKVNEGNALKRAYDLLKQGYQVTITTDYSFRTYSFKSLDDFNQQGWGKYFKESKLNEEADDGWSKDIKYQLEEVLERAYNLQYEVNNCVRGAYTGCDTSEELSEYVKDLGEDFTLIGEDLPNYPAYDEMSESLKEATLTEKKWEHQLPEETAKGLRSAIDEGDIDAVGAMLQLAWSSIHEMMPEEFDEFDLEDKIQYIDDIEEEDEMDYELSDFYDFCDANSIWIPLD